jgi:hypothetical protein
MMMHGLADFNSKMDTRYNNYKKEEFYRKKEESYKNINAIFFAEYF